MEEQQEQNVLSLGKFTVAEVQAGLNRLAPILAQAWNTDLDDDALWQQRARYHGRLRTWWLRWQLRKQKKASE